MLTIIYIIEAILTFLFAYATQPRLGYRKRFATICAICWPIYWVLFVIAFIQWCFWGVH